MNHHLTNTICRNKAFRQSAGFTLVELMVAIVLGLLLVAAAIQLFTGGLISTRLQQANAQVQDSGIFGLEYVARDVKLANFGNVANLVLNDRTSWGGVVLTARTASTNNTNLRATASAAPTYIPDGLLTHSFASNETLGTADNEWKGLSNVAEKSDQLTIQFIAPMDMTNCEGEIVSVNDLVVQRYFIRGDSKAGARDYALACDANDPTESGADPQPAIVTGLGDAGEIIIPRVDHFHILLGTRLANGQLAYYTVNQYRTAAANARAGNPSAIPPVAGVAPPRILSIKIAILVRSPDTTNSGLINASKSYSLLDQTVTPLDTTTKFTRHVYSTTVALRNGMGDQS